MNQESQQFQKRILHLEETSWKESRFVFTDFLNEAEYSDVLSLGMPSCGMRSYGGFEGAARVMVRFGDPEIFGYEESFPIAALCITPLSEKFADALTHRDYLGAILNLGIERRVIGDILIDGVTGYVLCKSNLADYLSEHLVRIKHTSVRTTIVSSLPDKLGPVLSMQEIQTSSIRIDCVIAQVCRLSRSKSQELLHSGQVFINGRAVQNAASLLRENDEISVRHYGKFRYIGPVRETRKGNLLIQIGRYV